MGEKPGLGLRDRTHGSCRVMHTRPSTSATRLLFDCTRRSGASAFPLPFILQIYIANCCLIISPDNPAHASSLSFAFYMLSSSLNPIFPLFSCLSQSSASPRLIASHIDTLMSWYASRTLLPFLTIPLSSKLHPNLYDHISLFHSPPPYIPLCSVSPFSFLFNFSSFEHC